MNIYRVKYKFSSDKGSNDYSGVRANTKDEAREIVKRKLEFSYSHYGTVEILDVIEECI